LAAQTIHRLQQAEQAEQLRPQVEVVLVAQQAQVVIRLERAVQPLVQVELLVLVVVVAASENKFLNF
jgi:hypothetical protein